MKWGLGGSLSFCSDWSCWPVPRLIPANRADGLFIPPSAFRLITHLPPRLLSRFLAPARLSCRCLPWQVLSWEGAPQVMEELLMKGEKHGWREVGARMAWSVSLVVENYLLLVLFCFFLASWCRWIFFQPHTRHILQHMQPEMLNSGWHTADILSNDISHCKAWDHSRMCGYWKNTTGTAELKPKFSCQVFDVAHKASPAKLSKDAALLLLAYQNNIFGVHEAIADKCCPTMDPSPLSHPWKLRSG